MSATIFCGQTAGTSSKRPRSGSGGCRGTGSRTSASRMFLGPPPTSSGEIPRGGSFVGFGARRRALESWSIGPCAPYGATMEDRFPHLALESADECDADALLRGDFADRARCHVCRGSRGVAADETRSQVSVGAVSLHRRVRHGNRALHPRSAQGADGTRRAEARPPCPCRTRPRPRSPVNSSCSAHSATTGLERLSGIGPGHRDRGGTRRLYRL